jgi:hypothetical protein
MKTPTEKQFRQMTVDELRRTWGGRVPTWEEFRAARKEGRVRTHKGLALDAVWWRGMPRMGQALFGLVTPCATFLVLPAAIGAHFFLGTSGWWILGSAVAAWCFYKESQIGACRTIETAAESNPGLYDLLVNNGAFLIRPPSG